MEATVKERFWQGVRAISPIIIGVLPFALITGISAISNNLSPLEGMGMSLILFAGASQLAVVQLYGSQAPAIVAIMTAVVINLRFMIYSASLAPHIKETATSAKAGLAFILTDQGYAISITEFEKQPNMTKKAWFYFGASATLWVVWQGGSLLGIVMGEAIPKSWGLDFAIPLTFLALLVPALKDRPSILAALFAGFVSLAAFNLPYNLGLPLAVFSGIAAGYIFEQLIQKKQLPDRAEDEGGEMP